MARTMKSATIARRRDPDEKLTLAEVCAELRIERSTFYDWRAKGRAPKVSKLPNGELRIVRRDLDAWFESCRVA
jgi:predicted DNA-binding transcriptional regulator AlpA